MGFVSKVTDLEGTWLAVEATVGGQAEPKIVGQRFTVAGDHFQIAKNGELLYGGGITVGTGYKLGIVDLDQCETETLSGTWRGIYRREGDALEICDNALRMEGPRPHGFGQRNDEGHVWVRFQRQH